MLNSLFGFVGRVLRALIGLVVVLGALALGIVVAAGVMLRLAWLRRGRPRRAPRPERHRAPRAGGEVIDVEAREVRAN